jgi:hypothetical protein
MRFGRYVQLNGIDTQKTSQRELHMTPGLNTAKTVVYGFAAIFCMIGLGIGYAAVVNFEDGDSTKTILTLFAALAFGGFGVAVLALTRAGFRTKAREESLRAAHPDEPWKWQDDWITGRIRSTNSATARFLWGFSILWNLISTPLLIVLPSEIIEKENYGALLGLLFPLVGVGLIVAAVRKTIQGRKFGECLFLMDRVPGVLGGELAGTILVPRGLPVAGTLSVRLTCVHEITRRSGKSTTTDENVLWQTEKSNVQLSPTGDVTAQGATVRFPIPFDVKPSGKIDENNRIFWKLEADTAVPGVDFATVFEIPVFKTQASSPENTGEKLRSKEMQTILPSFTPGDHQTVAIVPSAGGGTEFVIYPNKGVPGGLPVMILVLIFAGIAVLLWYAEAPFLFPLVFGAIAMLLVFLLLFGSFGESRMVIEDGHVSVRNSLFGIMSGRRMLCSSIAKINVNGQGSTGKWGYYSITLVQNDGKSASPMQGLSERRQADWLAEEVRKAMEPWRSHQTREETSHV